MIGTPLWMNDFVQSKIKRKNQFYKTHAENGYKLNDHLHFQKTTNIVYEAIAKRKQDYHSNLALKLNSPATSAKTY